MSIYQYTPYLHLLVPMAHQLPSLQCVVKMPSVSSDFTHSLGPADLRVRHLKKNEHTPHHHQYPCYCTSPPISACRNVCMFLQLIGSLISMEGWAFSHAFQINCEAEYVQCTADVYVYIAAIVMYSLNTHRSAVHHTPLSFLSALLSHHKLSWSMFEQQENYLKQHFFFFFFHQIFSNISSWGSIICT